MRPRLIKLRLKSPYLTFKINLYLFNYKIKLRKVNYLKLSHKKVMQFDEQIHQLHRVFQKDEQEE